VWSSFNPKKPKKSNILGLSRDAEKSNETEESLLAQDSSPYLVRSGPKIRDSPVWSIPGNTTGRTDRTDFWCPCDPVAAIMALKDNGLMGWGREVCAGSQRPERRPTRMDCPRCKVPLRTEDYRGIEVDRCPQCQGMWLDYGELDQLEDEVFKDDELKGTLVYGAFKSELACPRCGRPMTGFRYRANNLELDMCDEGHGTWLDGGEEKRVLELMAQRIKDLDRKEKAEAEWGDFLRQLRSPSFGTKIKRLFKK